MSIAGCSLPLASGASASRDAVPMSSGFASGPIDSGAVTECSGVAVSGSSSSSPTVTPRA
jgi:hypothetical protein